MQEFYTRFYAAAPRSAANAAYCAAVYGRNLCQHGFVDMSQIDEIMRTCAIGPQSRVLDLGGGNGMIAEYISDTTGAHVTGIDFILAAIEDALMRTADKRERLAFAVMDMGALDFPPASFDVILSLDTLYFTDFTRTVTALLRLLKPEGVLAVIYDQSAMPHEDLASYDRSQNLPDGNAFGRLLKDLGLTFESRCLNEEVLAHARRRLAIFPS